MPLSGQLRDVRLVRLGSVSVTPEERYHIVTPVEIEPSPATRLFLDWAVDQLTAEQTE